MTWSSQTFKISHRVLKSFLLTLKHFKWCFSAEKLTGPLHLALFFFKIQEGKIAYFDCSDCRKMVMSQLNRDCFRPINILSTAWGRGLWFVL